MSGRSDTTARWMTCSNCRTTSLPASRLRRAGNHPGGDRARARKTAGRSRCMGSLFAGNGRLSQDDEAGCGCRDCRPGEGDHDRARFRHRARPAWAMPCACRDARMGSPGAPRVRRGPRLRRTSSSSWPTSPEANQSLALVLVVTGRSDQAMRVAQRAIELNPNYAEAYAVLGHALIFCGDLEGGLRACHKAERGNPRDSRGTWLYDAMGHGYFFLGEYDKAIEVSKKGLHQDPALVRRASHTRLCLRPNRPQGRSQALCGRAARADSALFVACVAQEPNDCRSQIG